MEMYNPGVRRVERQEAIDRLAQKIRHALVPLLRRIKGCHSALSYLGKLPDRQLQSLIREALLEVSRDTSFPRTNR